MDEQAIATLYEELALQDERFAEARRALEARGDALLDPRIVEVFFAEVEDVVSTAAIASPLGNMMSGIRI